MKPVVVEDAHTHTHKHTHQSGWTLEWTNEELKGCKRAEDQFSFRRPKTMRRDGLQEITLIFALLKGFPIWRDVWTFLSATSSSYFIF